MVQRIKKFPLAQSLAFQGGVEQADENLELSQSVQPVLPIPFVPPPAKTSRLPFYFGTGQSGVANEFRHNGLFCSSSEYIVHLKRIDVINVTGASTEVQLRREDNPISGVTVLQIVPLYIDAGPKLLPVDKSVVTSSDAAPRGTNLGTNRPVLDDEVLKIELDCYIQGGVLWVVETTVNRALRVFFMGEVIPVIQGQPAG